MPLTKEQFNKARNAGFTTEQIASFEKKRTSSISNSSVETPQQSSMQNIMGDIKEFGQGVYREEVAPILKGVDAFAFGIPRTLIKSVGGQELDKQIFPDQQTLRGQVASFGLQGAGMLRGGAAKLAHVAGERLTPKLAAKIGMSIERGEMAARSSAVLANKIIKGSIEGAIFGFTQLTPDEEGHISPMGQVAQGAVGGVFGSAFPIATNLATKGVRGYRKMLTPTKTPPSKLMIEALREKEKLQKEIIRTQAKTSIENIDDAIYEANKQRKQVLFENRVDFDKNLKEKAFELKKQVVSLGRALNDVTSETSKEVQRRLPQFYKANSSGFEKEIDSISDGLIRRNEQLNYREISDMLSRVGAEMDDALILDGRPREAILALQNKYAVKYVSQPSKFFRASSGTPVGGSIASNADAIVPLKEFFNDIKSIRKTLTAGAKSGATRFSQEDVAVSLFNKGTAELLETRVPELIKLRESYSPIINAMKVSNRIFKPFKGEFDIKEGANLLERFSLGKSKAGEIELIKAIEEGSSFSPGIGDITSQLRAKGLELMEAKQRIAPILDDMRNVNLFQRQGIDKEFAAQIHKLRMDKRFIDSNSIVQEKMLEDMVADRLKKIGARQEMIDNLKADKNKLRTVIKRLLALGTATSTGTVGTKNIIKTYPH